MDLSKKLQYYKSAQNPPGIQTDHVLSPSLKALQEHFNGEIMHPEAPYLKISRPVELPSGTGGALKLDFLSRSLLDTSIDPETCVFFDLETTGLAGGAGTFAFLIGFLYIRDGKAVVDQYFLPDYGREYHLFKHLSVFLDGFHVLVSYNGKTYDLPLLKNRLLLNRIESDLHTKKHLDLLHIVRRIWGGSIPSCDLQSIEKKLNLVERVNDIPGAFIPQAYFDFINTGIIHDIIRLIEHNYYDLTSLLQLVYISSTINNHHDPLNDDRYALINLAKLAYQEKNESYLDRIIAELRDSEGMVPPAVLFWKSMLLKVQRRWEQAITIWEELTRHSSYTFRVLEELAKYHEHVAGDYEQALVYTGRAIQQIRTLISLHSGSEYQETLNAFLYRKNRLSQKNSVPSK